MYDEKVLAYVCLQGQFKELQHNNCQLEKSYEKNFQHQQEKIEELQNFNLELQSKMNKSDNSSQLSLTPPPYNYLSAHIHSTPYSSNKKIRVKDSLYSELKASGFNLDDAQNQDVKEKLIFYKEEIANIINVIDETLKDIATSRNEICVPNLQIMEMDIIENLKYKISTLVNSVKTCATVKESVLSSRVDDSREKSDVLAEAKKTSSLVNDRAFTSVKREDDLIGSVTLSVTSMLSKEVHSTCDKSRSSVMETSDCSKNLEAFEPNDDESIEPMSEALNRIIELKGSDNIEEMESVIYPMHKQKSIYTAKNNMDWFTMGSKVTQSSDSSSYINAKGDGPRHNINNTNDSNSQTYQINATSDNLKSAFTKYSSNNDKSVNELDMRYVTLRSIDETYLLNPVVSSSEENSPGLQQFKTDSKPQVMDYHTPVHNQNQKITPHRKLSVCYPTFGIDSLQIPDSAHNASGEIRHSFATSNTEGSEYTDSSIKLSIPLESSATRDQLMNSYRCPNNNDSSSSSYSKTDESPVSEPMDDSINEATKMIKKVNLAPSKLQFSDSISNQTLPVNGETKNWKTNTISQRNSEFETFSENIAAQQSRILSSSSNLMKANEQRDKYNITLDSRNIGGSASFSEFTNDLTNQCLSSNNSVGYQNNAYNVFLSNADKNDQTYTKKGVSTEGRRQRAAIVASTTTAASGAAVAAAAAAVGVGASTRSCSGEESTTTVGRAMSSGEEEESSAESECEAPRPTSDNTEAEEPALEDKVELIINVNGIDTDNNCQKIISNSPSHDVVKEDESPKAFPSWTDERLQESGIASFPDINSEISENLSEDELKKKYTAFSIGLGTDRMTLSKRMILSRRHRDQAEKNFTNEVSKMQQDIKELAPLCVDSESVERVERVKQQLEMVARCAHRISCSAETLGAVHQERRVSRAVLLADKYMQTLRTKCEKLAVELAETKRILAENNIVLEENLSEMGDDFPRVRYRGVPNNNRTMMARRRASIAAISRPLMGSNQDISKELPRQRNSVSGRVPGLRRPSLCFETPKWEIEKLDRTDSSSSISEMREIFEQTESRRHSQEENNNSIRTSIKNLSNTNEYIEGEDHWSNSREDIVPELSNDNEIISVEIGQNYGHPFVCWLLNRYMTWKPMLWCILIAFLLGFFINRVVSSSRRDGPPLSWWSIEEILNQYIQINNGKHQIPRPI
ncbi:PREDICTED: probable serine/threonine-protein kinase DDB_G0282963 [Ceratosolen solmsi marchali]|uniref:Probable serine/threonine-protein kinase DDB_G0282963 n=1 Tax=Ceratosolen solmsi marchali TaxID=326594 RepID=A0AAJ7DYL9_9HYME|nr:PREDICTED: probable serine/threonine-protein kinase DDB_G0282963 [Ceratosolen solmsi marchali]